MIHGLLSERGRVAWDNKYRLGFALVTIIKCNICFENNEARCNIKSLIEYQNVCSLQIETETCELKRSGAYSVRKWNS